MPIFVSMLKIGEDELKSTGNKDVPHMVRVSLSENDGEMYIPLLKFDTEDELLTCFRKIQKAEEKDAWV